MNYIVDELFQLSDAMHDHGSMDNDHLNTLGTPPSSPNAFLQPAYSFFSLKPRLNIPHSPL